MARRRYSNLFPWANMARMATQNAMLAMEAQQVIALRLAKMAMGGPDVNREAQLMVSEKVKAMAESGQIMAAAAISGRQDLGAEKVVRHYRGKVRANRKRLSG